MSPRRAVLAALSLLLAFPLVARAAEAEPLRIASLVPFVSEAVAEWPDKAELVAAVRRSMHQPVPAGVADLGSPHQPSLEPLVAARPQLIVADERLHALLKPQLEATGAEVLMVRADSVAATFDGLRAVARRAGTEAALESRLAAVEERLAALATPGAPTVLPLFGAPGSFLLVTPRTWLGDLLVRLGVGSERTPPGRETMPGYVLLADEVLAASHPDHVLLLAHGSPEVVAKAFAETWARYGNDEVPVHVLDPRMFSTNPGLRMAEAAEAVVALLAAPRTASVKAAETVR
jgi:iron complex transport system substrate-binding protein